MSNFCCVQEFMTLCWFKMQGSLLYNVLCMEIVQFNVSKHYHSQHKRGMMTLSWSYFKKTEPTCMQLGVWAYESWRSRVCRSSEWRSAWTLARSSSLNFASCLVSAILTLYNTSVFASCWLKVASTSDETVADKSSWLSPHPFLCKPSP